MLRRVAAASLALLSGCVTQGTYDALKAEHDATLATLQGRDRDNETLRGTLSKEQQRNRDLTSETARLETELAEVTKAKAQLESELAGAQSDRTTLKSSVEAMKKTLAELARRKQEIEARVAEFKGMLARFKSLIDAGKLKVKIVDGRMVVELASDILFSSGSAQLSKSGKAAVTEVAQVLASIPDRSFQIEGHTDNTPMAGGAYANWELGSARALNVLKNMVDAGMPGNRISAASFGDSKPAKPNDTKEGKEANRRIEIVVVPDLSSLPGFEELKKASAR